MFVQRALTLTAFLLLTQNVLAQRSVVDTSYVATAKSNLQKKYSEERKSELLLIRGTDYAEYEAILDEHPFFLSDDWMFGTICYNENVYAQVPLQYDIHSDKLVTENPATGRKIELVKQNVSWFILEGHRFIFLEGSNVPSGYYELLVNGSAQLLANYHKAFQESTATGKLQVRVEEIKRYYIFKNGLLSPVKGKSTLLAALSDQRSVIQQEIKRRKLNFNKNKEQALAESVSIYNSLQQK
jgi:hypothetical protein